MISSSNKKILSAILIVVFILTACERIDEQELGESRRMHLNVIDPVGPPNPWGKSVGDINGDGLPDLIVGGHGNSHLSLFERLLVKLSIQEIKNQVGELVWYENPGWQKHLISDKYKFSTDHEVADVDGDGLMDIVSLTDQQLVWFRNPDWTSIVIESRALHDIELNDLDADGKIDIIGRNQSRFGHNDGNKLHFYRQNHPSDWTHFAIIIPHGEGLKVADMDGDMKPDIVVNGYWYKNPGSLSEKRLWDGYTYGSTWQWPDVFIDVADINKDGQPDVVLAPAEPQGERYHISWFESPALENSDWREHVIDDGVETVHHFIAAKDMDNDGEIDIITSEMHQGQDPDETKVYWNHDAGQQWRKEVIATTGSHSMQAKDIDNDGDIDLFGANWSGKYQAVELWKNHTCPTTWNKWRRQVIDAHKPWRTVFIVSADLDQDGYQDVITGGWWYRNPGRIDGIWHRLLLGEPANNVAMVMDFDADGDLDILASQWKAPLNWTVYERILKKLGIRSYPPSNGFVWARNEGQGRFEIIHNVASGKGDFLQGAAVLSSKNSTDIALSWHEPGHGIQMLSVPADPVQGDWKWRHISNDSQDEELTVADIDGDGDPDLVLGTKWLRNEGHDIWTPFNLYHSDQNPDRHRVVDMNGDGRLDVVVGYEAISAPGKVAWYEQGPDPTQPWFEHPVATAIGPMSLDVSDMDQNGDWDIILGEHNLKAPETSRLLIFENRDGRALNWREHVVYTGDEHHNGARVVDIDNDGDGDILSIGWNQDQVLLYENQNLSGQCPKTSQ